MKMQKLSTVIKRHAITMLVERSDSNPHMEGGANMDHWQCKLISAKGRMSLRFSMGKGHGGKPPTLDTVLDCIASDAAGVEGPQTFEGWCQDYGYDADSRKAEHTYKTIKRQLGQLERLIGDKDALNDLLFKTERL